MKMIFLLLSSLFFIQFNGFSQEFVPSERKKKSYREILNLYPQYFISHLPENIDNVKIGFIELLFPRGKYLSFIHLILPYTDSEIEVLKKKATLDAKAIYTFKDSCLVLPYDYEEFEIIKSDSIRNIPFADMLPIPNFSSWECVFAPKFYNEAEIFLLDAEQGRFLPDDCLSKSGAGLPKEWEHGYTKGLMFYRNYVTYWLEVW